MNYSDIERIWNEAMNDPTMNYETAFGYALEEIARQAGIHFTGDDILWELLTEKCYAFADWAAARNLQI